MTEVDQPIPLSASDVTVLNLLQSDISLSRQELAEKAGLSPSTLWRRISELEVIGAIRKRVALLNPDKVGLSVVVFVSINLVDHTKETRNTFEEFVNRSPNIMESFLVTGTFDYMLIIRTKTVGHFEKLLMDEILAQKAVASASSNIALRQRKYTTTLPL